MPRLFSRIFLGLILLSAFACTKNTEQDDLSQAQACLDNVPQGDFDAANACLPLTKDYTSQEAMILKCSIIITSGGLMEAKVIAAANAFKDTTQTNQTAAYMAALSLDYPDINTGYTKALQADPFCQATNIAGYQYLSGLIVAGTFMEKVVGSIDITNPSAAQAAVTTLLADCVGASPSATCTDNISALGGATASLANSYCSTTGANASVCSQVNGAVNSAGSDPSNVGKALLCYLNKQTYSPTDGLCH
jgi:hypothetical protein